MLIPQGHELPGVVFPSSRRLERNDIATTTPAARTYCSENIVVCGPDNKFHYSWALI